MVDIFDDQHMDYLLLVRWDLLSPTEKALAIEKVSTKAYSALDRLINDCDKIDYYDLVVSPLLSKEPAAAYHAGWWQQIKNSELYQREERVIAFKESLKAIRRRIAA